MAGNKILNSLLLLLALAIAGCNNGKKGIHPDSQVSGHLVIFHAGSLAVPFKMIADSFMTMNPGVKVEAESAGSLASIRKITDLKRPCDVLASADYSLIDKLMIPEFASWNLQFAGNEMVIAYRNGALKSTSLNRDNWHAVLLDPEVRYGRSDPDSDPCGYRTLLCLKLAEKHYHRANLESLFRNKDQRYIRPKEVDLLALLESETIDYIFIYKSVAIQHSLPFLSLPDSINLSNPLLKSHYAGVSVKISGNKPGEYIVQSGEPIVYGLTIPENAGNRDAANAFVDFMITQGKAILEESGQNQVGPYVTGSHEKLPENLKPFLK